MTGRMTTFTTTRLTTITFLTVTSLVFLNGGVVMGCWPFPKPHHSEIAKTARWLVHSSSWGIISTISTRNLTGTTSLSPPLPFGNVYSLSDGPCDNSTGTIYIYGSDLDVTYRDLNANPTASVTLSEAGLGEAQYWQVSGSCHPGRGWGDPETPPCARLVLTGYFEKIAGGSAEEEWARAALFSRHPAMEHWPRNHRFYFQKLIVEDLFFLDWFGGPPAISVEEYFETEVDLSWQNKMSGRISKFLPGKINWDMMNEAANMLPWLR